MKISLGELEESATNSVRIHSYGRFIALDMHEAGKNPSYIPTNISVAEAKQIRDELDAAIKHAEENA